MIILDAEDYNYDLLHLGLDILLNISILAFISVIASIALVATCIVVSAIATFIQKIKYCLQKIWYYLLNKNEKQKTKHKFNRNCLLPYHTIQ